MVAPTIRFVIRRGIISGATKWRQIVALGERWLALQAKRNPGSVWQSRLATSDRFANPKMDAESQPPTPPTQWTGEPAPSVMPAFQSVATRCDFIWFAYQPLVAGCVVLVNPGLRSTRGARLRLPEATPFSQLRGSQNHPIPKPESDPSEAITVASKRPDPLDLFSGALNDARSSSMAGFRPEVATTSCRRDGRFATHQERKRCLRRRCGSDGLQVRSDG